MAASSFDATHRVVHLAHHLRLRRMDHWGTLVSEHKPYPQEHPHFIQGREFERARIIALLEAEHSEFTFRGDENKGTYIDDCAACFAIALIKGENE